MGSAEGRSHSHIQMNDDWDDYSCCILLYAYWCISKRGPPEADPIVYLLPISISNHLFDLFIRM